MNEPENFLARWSRRKQQAVREPDMPHGPDAEQASAPPERTDDVKPAAEKEPALDLSSLPSLDSIGANTDISTFLQKGVPLDLAHAALRRAWGADPAIRDFIGIAENQWDFATGSGIPGFGPLEASDGLRQIAARVANEGLPDLGDHRTEIARAGQHASEKSEESAQGEPPQVVSSPPPVDQSSTLEDGPDQACADHEPAQVRATDHAALQQEDKPEQTVVPPSRGHGGALPQ